MRLKSKMPSTENPLSKPEPNDPQAVVAARCQEIQSCLGALEVPEFENIPMIGMAVRLSLHINGLPLIDYEVLKRVLCGYAWDSSLSR